jgi:hypothetical protein
MRLFHAGTERSRTLAHHASLEKNKKNQWVEIKYSQGVRSSVYSFAMCAAFFEEQLH